MNNEKKELGLLGRLYEMKSRLTRPLITIMIASMLSTGCSSTLDPDSSDPNSKDPTQNEQSGGQTGEQTSKHSKLLQDVINDPEYKSLISQGKSYERFFDTAYFDPHPYGFLEDQGYDIDSIKNGKTECYTISYKLDAEPNNLYIYTRVKEDATYCTTYVIKYSLTELEMSDYRLMHNNLTDLTYYVQCVFMNDAISRTKTPVEVKKATLTNETQKSMSDYYVDYLNIKPFMSEIAMSNLQDYSLDIHVLPKYEAARQASFRDNIYQISCITLLPINTNIYNGPNKPHPMAMAEISNISCPATIFCSQNICIYSNQCNFSC